MTWAKLDDGFPFDLKIRTVSDAAFRLDVSGICWSASHGSDGHIEPGWLGLLSDVKKPAAAAAELVNSGRWHIPGHECPSKWCRAIEDGWLIHNYLRYNPAASYAAIKSQRRSEAGAKGGKASARTRANLRAVGEANG